MQSTLLRTRLASATLVTHRRLSTTPRSSWPNSNGSSSSSSTPPTSPPPPPLGTSASSPASPAARKLKVTRRREWTWVALSGSVATLGAYYLYTSRKSLDAPDAAASKRVFSGLVGSAAAPPKFSIHVRGANGVVEDKIIQALSKAQVARRLTAHEESTNVGRKACLVSRYDTNVVASNEPVEDRHAEAIVQRDVQVKRAGVEEKEEEEKGDLAFFAVMDGHAGWNTSEFLSKQLIAAVAVELDHVFRGTGPYATLAASKSALPSKAWRALFSSSSLPAAHSDAALDADPEIVARALAQAFLRLDEHITRTPVELLRRYQTLAAQSGGAVGEIGVKSASKEGERGIKSLSALASSLLPQQGASSTSGTSSNNNSTAAAAAVAASLPTPDVETALALRRAGYEALLPALSGSCALLTYVDSARGDVYVACTGDSRAVAGWYDVASQKWSVEALSEDQTGRSPSEVKRMQAEHPASESESVIMRGRVLGGLEPTRAFGDARYKWTRELQEQLTSTLLPGGKASARAPPRALQTPPYVTARPEVTWRCVNTAAKRDGKELRWIVMATDGLWDMLPTQDVGALVSAHLDGARGDFTAGELKARLENGAAASAGGEAAKQPQAATSSGARAEHPLSRGKEAQYCFEDANLATHLIRNALGGANRDRVAGLLAITAPDARRFRDDITVNVILFNSKAEQLKEEANIAAEAETPVQAKL